MEELIIPFSDNYKKLKEYVFEGGSDSEMPAELSEYKKRVDIAHDIFKARGHFAKGSKYIANLIKLRLECTQHAAWQLLYEAQNLYYAEATMTKEIFRNFQIERLDKFIMSADARGDYRSVANLVKLQNELMRVNVEEKSFPQEYYRKSIMVVTTKPEDVGLKRVPRAQLASQIDHFLIAQDEKTRIMRDAGITVNEKEVTDVQPEP